MHEAYIGQTIGGCTITRGVGQGGGGLVFLGDHSDYGKNIVLKILPKDQKEDEQARKRFEREIEMSIDLTHPSIVQIFQASADSEYYYILMEYVDGPDVDTAVQDRDVFAWKQANSLMIQVAEALQFAHEKNIVHRDIKPSNILLNKAQTVAKLCDFGLAKNLNVESNLTHTGMVLGTPNFMSPEQWFGAKDLTPQSDIYSLGATYFFMLTAQKPFEGDSASAIMTNSLFSEPPTPANFVTGLPAQITTVMQKMLARDLEDRYASAVEVIEALRGLEGSSSGGILGKLFGRKK